VAAVVGITGGYGAPGAAVCLGVGEVTGAAVQEIAD
jgi:hypothetical protein